MIPVFQPQRQPFPGFSTNALLIVWITVAATSFVIGWFSFSKVEEAIPLPGTLEETSTFKSVLAPTGSIIKQVYVQPGQHVTKGDLLISFDQSVSRAKFDQLQQYKHQLIQRQRFFQAVIQPNLSLHQLDKLTMNVQLPLEAIALSRERLSLLETMKQTPSLTPTVASSDRFPELERWQGQLKQLRLRLDEVQFQLIGDQASLTELESGGRQEGDPPFSSEVTPSSAKERDLSRLREAVRVHQSKVNGLTEQINQIEQVLDLANQTHPPGNLDSSSPSPVDGLQQERLRLKEIDRQFQNALAADTNQLKRLDQELIKYQRTLKDELLTAPISGIITDLRAVNPGFVNDGVEPLLKIVPDGALAARILIRLTDLPFVETGKGVEVKLNQADDNSLLKGRIVRIDGQNQRSSAQDGVPAVVHFTQLPVHSSSRSLYSGMPVTAIVRIQDRWLIQAIANQVTKWLD